ncbi:MAG: globin, partial [Acidobacteriota bacterium]|nr:globin [Acidobacteriota bacterium]
KGFLDLFYRLFLESSPKVREKFADTDFERQKTALRASFILMRLVAADNGVGADKHLKELAVRHSSADLNIGAELYDLWLDSLISAVESYDPEFDDEIGEAWEKVMGVGIRYLLSHYHPSAAV